MVLAHATRAYYHHLTQNGKYRRFSPIDAAIWGIYRKTAHTLVLSGWWKGTWGCFARLGRECLGAAFFVAHLITSPPIPYWIAVIIVVSLVAITAVNGWSRATDCCRLPLSVPCSQRTHLWQIESLPRRWECSHMSAYHSSSVVFLLFILHIIIPCTGSWSLVPG